MFQQNWQRLVFSNLRVRWIGCDGEIAFRNSLYRPVLLHSSGPNRRQIHFRRSHQISSKMWIELDYRSDIVRETKCAGVEKAKKKAPSSSTFVAEIRRNVKKVNPRTK